MTGIVDGVGDEALDFSGQDGLDFVHRFGSENIRFSEHNVAPRNLEDLPVDAVSQAQSGLLVKLGVELF